MSYALLMKELDGRKISRAALAEIRILAVRRGESSESPEVVVKAPGFTRTFIYKWLANYREDGIDALRGRKAPGKIPKLNGNQIMKFTDLSSALTHCNSNLSLPFGRVEWFGN